MLKKTITFEDFDGDMQTQDFYFNLTKTELAEMNVSVEGGMVALLEKMIAAENAKEMLEFFKRIVLLSVGLRTDAQHFKKSPEIADDFVSSPAFDVLFIELFSDEAKAAAFVNGIMPKNLVAEMEAAEKNKPLVAVAATEE
jgi:hypothetical protein